jgi:hypothetical protein
LRAEPGGMPFAQIMADLAGNTQARDLGPLHAWCARR